MADQFPSYIANQWTGAQPRNTIKFSSTEITYYTECFNQARQTKSDQDFIEGTEAVAFLRKSSLPIATLRGIWELADRKKQGKLGKLEFFLAMRLIALAQQNKAMSLEAVMAVSFAGIPRFVGVPCPSDSQPTDLTPQAQPQPQAQITPQHHPQSAVPQLSAAPAHSSPMASGGVPSKAPLTRAQTANSLDHAEKLMGSVQVMRRAAMEHTGMLAVKDRLPDLKPMLDALDDAKQATARSLQHLSNDFEEVRKEFEDARAQVDAKQRELVDMRAQKAALTAKIQLVRDDIERMTQDDRKLDEAVRDQQREVAVLQQEFDEQVSLLAARQVTRARLLRQAVDAAKRRAEAIADAELPAPVPDVVVATQQPDMWDPTPANSSPVASVHAVEHEEAQPPAPDQTQPEADTQPEPVVVKEEQTIEEPVVDPEAPEETEEKVATQGAVEDLFDAMEMEQFPEQPPAPSGAADEFDWDSFN
ncbi:Cytoskeletal-regulatory complex EF hand [Carpediemonas membranifera]|uniref:Cytoskeletal-regulatory complex EF hand n=1 Tax=Carpediemonas membranifera TaxID=201153 RepID=A0A8J6AQA3_9EUKA|nr:Cytoskeletal-regulatory complex EF hand [Carpediemonas membranifera]|eukprot:KAG9391186.1 Cytoskeletal-regulatory complex EF hand [Carpediemonas membranifera]